PRSAPGTTSGRALLAHELTHVAQAQRGLHFALEGGGGDGAHEQEARSVEQSVNGAHTHSEDETRKVAKAKARDQEIIRRVFQLLQDDVEDRKLRGGTEWESGPRDRREPRAAGGSGARSSAAGSQLPRPARLQPERRAGRLRRRHLRARQLRRRGPAGGGAL